MDIDNIKASRPKLSRREIEVAVDIASGLTYPKIASRLSISHETVRTYVAKLRDKTGIRNKSQLAVWATLNYDWLRSELDGKLRGGKESNE